MSLINVCERSKIVFEWTYSADFNELPRQFRRASTHTSHPLQSCRPKQAVGRPGQVNEALMLLYYFTVLPWYSAMVFVLPYTAYQWRIPSDRDKTNKNNMLGVSALPSPLLLPLFGFLFSSASPHHAKATWIEAPAQLLACRWWAKHTHGHVCQCVLARRSHIHGPRCRCIGGKTYYSGVYTRQRSRTNKNISTPALLIHIIPLDSVVYWIWCMMQVTLQVVPYRHNIRQQSFHFE